MFKEKDMEEETFAHGCFDVIAEMTNAMKDAWLDVVEKHQDFCDKYLDINAAFMTVIDLLVDAHAKVMAEDGTPYKETVQKIAISLMMRSEKPITHV